MSKKSQCGLCRGYSHDECDFVEGDYEYDPHFTDEKQMEECIKVKFDNNLKTQKVAKKGASKAS